MKTPGPYEAIVLADSIASGVRLTTLCCTFPRFILAEFNTHRVFSRNSASSRAIPVKKRIAQIRENPYVPLQFGKNKRGMQAKDEEIAEAEQARNLWLAASLRACSYAELLSSIGLHKQWANRLLEPFAWHTVIVTSTEWDNWDALRISEQAQPEICKVAEAMLVARNESEPVDLSSGQWHLPLVMGRGPLPDDASITNAVYDKDRLVKLCVARTAAVSYERHMDQNIEKELDRYDKLLSGGHMSPFEHPAVVGERSPDWAGVWAKGLVERTFVGDFIGNFRAPWIQHRKLIPGEAVFGSTT